jgi:phosphohistidine phosphatase
MRLILVRHAIAVPRGTAGVADDERPLTPRGVRRFERAARGLAALMPAPTVLLASPLERARHTAELLRRAWGRPRLTLEAALAEGDLQALAAVLGRHGRRAGALGLVGHEPHLSATLAYLLDTPHAERLAFRKGGVALVRVSGAFGPGAGTLEAFLPPRVLRRLTG